MTMKEIAAKLTAYYDNLKNLYEGVEDAEGGSGDNPSLAFGSDVVGSEDENQERRTPCVYDQEEEDESDPVSNLFHCHPIYCVVYVFLQFFVSVYALVNHDHLSSGWHPRAY